MLRSERNICTKYWFITCNNYDAEDEALYRSLPQQDWVESCVVCTDIGEKNLTPHIHAVIVCKRKERRRYLELRLRNKVVLFCGCDWLDPVPDVCGFVIFGKTNLVCLSFGEFDDGATSFKCFSI